MAQGKAKGKSGGKSRSRKDVQRRRTNPIRYFREMSEERKRFIRVLSGILVGLLALLVAISCISYFFTWSSDQSLLGDPDKMDYSQIAHNAGGKVGAQIGSLLVGHWFGVGALALVVTLLAISIRLLAPKKQFPAWRIVLLSIGAAFVLSFLGAYVADFTGGRNTFGGGYGGDCGEWVVDWAKNLFSTIVTGAMILALVVLWFFLASKKVASWFYSLGEPTQKDLEREKEREIIEETQPEEDEEEEEEDEDEEEEEPSSPKPSLWERFKKLLPGYDDETPVKEQIPEEPERTRVVDAPVAKPATLVAPVAPVSPVAPQPAPRPVQTDRGEGIVVVSTPTEGDKDIPVEAEGQQIEVVEGKEMVTEINEPLPPFDVKDELSRYELPSLELLGEYTSAQEKVSDEELKRNNYRIRAALKTYKIEVENVRAVVGPTVTLYKVYPAPGVKIAAIRALQDDIAMALHASGVRVITLNDSVGIEVPNDRPSMVPLRAMLNDPLYKESKAELPVAIGYATISQKVKVFDLADAPHLLVAGATKQGKSVGLNVLIMSLLYSKHPSELKFVFVDPKMVEFSAYSNLLHHYLAVLPNSADEQEELENSIAKSPKQAEAVLKSLCVEMDERYTLLSKAMVNNIKLYNSKWKDRHLLPTEGHHFMPYIVVVVDEYADLTMSAGTSGDSKALARSISSSIIRLAQKGRAAGIHVVLATQRPSVDVITGLIKSNFPTRIAFRVFSMTDSRTILDTPGAEKLIGKGDMIYYAGVDVERAQCAFISNDEIISITRFIGEQKGYKKSYNTPYYLPAPEPDQTEEGTSMLDVKNLDERFEDAAKLVVSTQRGSTSDLQRRLGMGYAKAGRVMDQLEAAGIVGPQEGSKPRQVLVSDLEELDRLIEAFRNQ